MSKSFSHVVITLAAHDACFSPFLPLSLCMIVIPLRLRAIVRGLLSSGSPATTTAFLGAARRRLTQAGGVPKTNHEPLFCIDHTGENVIPTVALQEILRRARTLYGAGMGFASLRLLAQPVRAAADFCWKESAILESTFATIDADLCQALQSSREEYEGGRTRDLAAARAALEELKAAVKESQIAVQSWKGVYPFERAATTLEFWKI
jgi:hypothetical protein